MKKLLLVANWKMNQSKEEAKQFMAHFKKLPSQHELVVAPSFTMLDFVGEQIKSTKFALAAQNLFFAPSGAFTGEVSAQMLADCKVSYVIIGHSERRQYFLESDQFINKKVHAALKNNIKPIICVGETLEQKEARVSFELIREQVMQALVDVPIEQAKNIVFAYEPVWAIGTGQAMSAQEANAMAAHILQMIENKYGEAVPVRVLYGGSVTEENAKQFFVFQNISGALVGGASLNAEKFKKLIG